MRVGGIAQQERGEREGPAVSLTKGAPSTLIPPYINWACAQWLRRPVGFRKRHDHL